MKNDMKKILTLLAIVLATLTSCKEELVQHSISVDPVKLSFNSAGGEDTVYVTSSAEWELFSESGWCHASSAGGNGDMEIVVTVEPNKDSKSGRTATLTFVSGDKEATLTVTQEKKEYSISIEPTELTFGAEGGEQEIVVTSSDEWEVTGESNWCYASVASGVDGDTVKFSVEPYTNTEEIRTAIYTFVCGDKEAVLNIEQEAKVYSISVEPAELTFVAAGEEKSVTVTSSDKWEFSSDESWISASEENGESGAAVNIVVEENEDAEVRTGVATFKCGDKQADVKITQEAKEFSILIEPTEIEFEAEGGEQTITVTSSDNWKLTADSDWVDVSDTVGNNGASVKISASFNNTSEQRAASIVFVCGNKAAELKLTQKANDFSISVEPAEVAFGAEGGKQTVEVTSSHEWTLTNDTDWITTSVNEGESDNSVKITVDYNTSGENKFGEITFACGDKTAVLKVTQESDGSPVIQFKDPYFLAAIIDQADINGDGQITEKEAASVKVLTTETSGNLSRNIDELKYFTGLEDFTLASVDIENLDCDLSCFRELQQFTLKAEINDLIAKGHTAIRSIVFDASSALNSALNVDVSNCSTLTTIDVKCGELNATNCTALNSISGYAKKANLTGCTALNEIYADVYINDVYINDGSFFSEEYNLTGCIGLTKVSICGSIKGYYQFGPVGNRTVNCTGCSSLVELTCSVGISPAEYSLTELILDGCYSLKELDCSFSFLKSLDLSECPVLSNLKIYSSDISSLDLSNNLALAELDCSDCKSLTSLDVSNLTDLATLDCSECNLTSLNLGNNPVLTELQCSRNQLTSLDVDITNCPALTTLLCSHNQLTFLDLGKFTALEELWCSENPLQKLILYKYNIIQSIKGIEEEYGDIIEYVE